MRENIAQHLVARSRVRKAKMISALDQTRRKRAVFAAVAVIIIGVFIVAECIGLVFAKREHDRQESIKLSSEIISNLAIISSSLQSGNQGLYDKSFNNLNRNVDHYRKNAYTKRYDARKAKALEEYVITLAHDRATISQINQLHAMLNQLSLIAESDDLVSNISAFRQNLIKLDENIAQIDSDNLASVKAELLSMTDQLEKQLEAITICVNVCPENIIADKVKLFEAQVKDGVAKISTLNEHIVEKYSPDRYILLLQ